MDKKLMTLALGLSLAALSSCGDNPPATAEPPQPVAEATEPEEDRDLFGATDEFEEFRYRPVAANRSLDIPEGFRGEVHPALHGEGSLQVNATWTPTLKDVFKGGINTGLVDTAEVPEYTIPEPLVKMVTDLTPARRSAPYSATELSALLPTELEEPGQIWTVDPEEAAVFLKQFHPGTSTTFDLYKQPYGRRPGPAGAFGLLRAVSDTHAEIDFRIHAEFLLREGVAIYTPACFLGRMVIDRTAGKVASFDVHVPYERSVNVNLTLMFPHPENPDDKMANIVFEHVKPMELHGGERDLGDRLTWDREIGTDEAFSKLESAFYKFMDIDWVPMEDAQAIAKREDKPLMAVVLTSPLTDQSC